jgi:hypothetical protein
MRIQNTFHSKALRLAVFLLTVFTSGCGNLEVTALTIISTNPNNDATAVPINNTIVATFSEIMDETTLTTDTFTVIGDNEAPLVGSISLDVASNTSIFTPASNLTASKRYTATITTLAKSSTGESLASNHVWTFTSGTTEDMTAPNVNSTNPDDPETNADQSSNNDNTALTIISTNPNNNASAVPINNTIVATFSESMDETTFTNDTFTVVGHNEAALVGSVSLDAASNTSSFTPTSNLTANTPYTATITTLAKSSKGESLASDYVWTFSSGTPEDVSAPTVSSTDPKNIEKNVALNRNITALFDESIDPASINLTSFTLMKDLGTTAIIGEVNYTDNLATFNPTDNFIANTAYAVTLTTEIKDLAGNTLATNYTWKFTTGTRTEAASSRMPVNLLTAGNFVILTKTGITNVPTSAITGDIGASPITAASMDNISCSEITGTIYGADAGYTGSGDVTCFAGTPPDNTLVANGVLDMGTAYNDAAGRINPDFTELHAGDLSGQTLIPGLYKWGTNVLINTDTTLNGGSNDVWIFQISGNIIQAANTSVLLTGGALAKNVFWQVAGGAGVALDTDATFAGVVLAEKKITVNTGTTIEGRLLSQTAVTLIMNTITQPAP